MMGPSLVNVLKTHIHWIPWCRSFSEDGCVRVYPHSFTVMFTVSHHFLHYHSSTLILWIRETSRYLLRTFSVIVRLKMSHLFFSSTDPPCLTRIPRICFEVSAFFSYHPILPVHRTSSTLSRYPVPLSRWVRYQCTSLRHVDTTFGGFLIGTCPIPVRT